MATNPPRSASEDVPTDLGDGRHERIPGGHLREPRAHARQPRAHARPEPSTPPSLASRRTSALLASTLTVAAVGLVAVPLMVADATVSVNVSPDQVLAATSAHLLTSGWSGCNPGFTLDFDGISDVTYTLAQPSSRLVIRAGSWDFVWTGSNAGPHGVPQAPDGKVHAISHVVVCGPGSTPSGSASGSGSGSASGSGSGSGSGSASGSGSGSGTPSGTSSSGTPSTTSSSGTPSTTSSSGTPSNTSSSGTPSNTSSSGTPSNTSSSGTPSNTSSSGTPSNTSSSGTPSNTSSSGTPSNTSSSGTPSTTSSSGIPSVTSTGPSATESLPSTGGSPSDSESLPNTGGTLPHTGSDPLVPLLSAVSLLAIGAIILAGTRRRGGHL